MTHWTELPHQPTQIETRCPTCEGKAKFVPATIVKMTCKQKEQLPRSCDWIEFDVDMIRVWPREGDNGLTATLYFPQLDNPCLDINQQARSRNTHYTNLQGTICCIGCGRRNKHDLVWPRDANYKIDLKGHILWAWNENDLCQIMEFIASRDRFEPSYNTCLATLPTIFLQAINRDAVVKKLGALLD